MQIQNTYSINKIVLSLFLVIAMLCNITASAQKTEKLLAAAKDYEVNGNYPKAIDTYQKLINIDPNNSDYLVAIGRLHYKQNDYRQAIADFRKSFDMDKSNFPALLNLGNLYSRLSLYDSALYYFNYVTTKYSNMKDGYFLKGNLYEILGNKDSACVNFERAKKNGHLFVQAKLNNCNDSTYNKDIHPILSLKQMSTDAKYGYTVFAPIQIGKSADGEDANAVAYLQLLRDYKGNPVLFKKLGKCCPIKVDSTSSNFMMLTRYQIVYINVRGQQDTRNVLFDTEHYEDPKIIMGFRSER